MIRDKRAVRRAVPIHAYVGPNGGGKSLAMVHDTLPSLAMGRPVLSTVQLLDDEGNPHPLWTPFEDYRQLLTWRDGDVLMDEVTGVASSRESNSLPPQVANYLVQLRRRDVLLRWTSPNWARADKIMREVTQGVTYCIGYLPKARQSDDGTRLWRDRRLFVWRSYDATAFDEFTAHKRESVRARSVQVFWRPGSAAEAAYDTLDAVLMLGATADGGLCITCGGKRTTPRCGCPDQTRHSERRRAASARTAQPEDGAPAASLDPVDGLPHSGDCLPSQEMQLPADLESPVLL